MIKIIYLIISLNIHSISCDKYNDSKLGQMIECYYIQDDVMKGVICNVHGCDMVEMI